MLKKSDLRATSIECGTSGHALFPSILTFTPCIFLPTDKCILTSSIAALYHSRRFYAIILKREPSIEQGSQGSLLIRIFAGP